MRKGLKLHAEIRKNAALTEVGRTYHDAVNAVAKTLALVQSVGSVNGTMKRLSHPQQASIEVALGSYLYNVLAVLDRFGASVMESPKRDVQLTLLCSDTSRWIEQLSLETQQYIRDILRRQV